MLIENINFLRKHHNYIYTLMKKIDNHKSADSVIEIFPAKNGIPSIKLKYQKSEVYIHSKYDPIKESERFLLRYEKDLSNHKNVVIFGIGLGYHIDLLLKKFPDKNYYLYEPDPNIFLSLLKVRNISGILRNTNYHLLIPENDLQRKEMLFNLSTHINNEFLLIVPQSYERIFKEDFLKFTQELKQHLTNHKSNLVVNISFEKRWTLNCIKNLKYTLKTPNILSNADSNPLKGKPALIVAAGPSLSEELSYIKQIKKEGTAYIFAVGSANKVLIKNGIEPDAVCTYDPQSHNFKVFEEMIDKEYTDVPMIFGTSVGYETLEKYKGPKLHMVTSQDSISPFFVESDKYSIIQDSPSIAVVTLQMLHLLGASPIIFVGQNLAYRDNEFYAQGIDYENRTQRLSERDRSNQIIVKSVFGNDISSNEGFLRMKESIEHYLRLWKRTDVFNTTVDGAEITGAPFRTLNDVKNEYLNKKVVKKEWFKDFSIQKTEYSQMLDKVERLKKSHQMHIRTITELKDILQKINMNLNSSDQKLEKLFYKLDKKVKKLENNQYYSLFIQNTIRVEREQIKLQSRNIKRMDSAKEKAIEIVNHFGTFVRNVIVNTDYMEDIFIELQKEALINSET